MLLIPNYPMYALTDDNEVFSFHRNRTLKPSIGNDGYPSVHLQGKRCSIHRLVAHARIPNPKCLPCVNHKDGNKLNYATDNLEWCTYAYNTKHAIDNKLYTVATRKTKPHAKLSIEEVDWVKANYLPYSKEYGMAAMANKFKVNKTTIWRIVNDKY